MIVEFDGIWRVCTCTHYVLSNYTVLNCIISLNDSRVWWRLKEPPNCHCYHHAIKPLLMPPVPLLKYIWVAKSALVYSLQTKHLLTWTLETQEYRSINVYKMATSSDGQIIATQPEVTLLISRRRSLNIFS